MKSVLVLMCTYNGAKFLKEQISSIINQIGVDWCLCVSDDGSTDDTIAILREYESFFGSSRIKIFNGPRQGFAKNFLSLVERIEANYSYYAFADQDDIWHADKLFRAISVIKESNLPFLYCSRTELVDSSGKFIGYSPDYKKLPSFENAIVQNIATGNTMVFNRSAFEVMKCGSMLDVPGHDWWAYILITGVGGNVYFDRTPSLKYRQHDANLFGQRTSFFHRLKRSAVGIFGNEYYPLIGHFYDAIEYRRSVFINKNIQTLNYYEQVFHSKRFIYKILYFFKSGVYRQTYSGNINLFIQSLLAKRM